MLRLSVVATPRSLAAVLADCESCSLFYLCLSVDSGEEFKFLASRNVLNTLVSLSLRQMLELVEYFADKNTF